MIYDPHHCPRWPNSSDDHYLAGTGALGDAAPMFGEVIRLRPQQVVTRSLVACTVVVEDVSPELVPFLEGAAGLIVSSHGPWEASHPGILTDDLGRSGLGQLLRALAVPTVWGVGPRADQLRDGDLAEVDPSAASVWWLAL